MPAHNHRIGATNTITSGVLQTGVSIQKGDIVLQNSSGYPYPAASETWDTDLATTQAAAKGKFLGIALESGAATQRVQVATDGEFVFPITTGTPNIGGPVGIAKASGNNLVSTSVATVATPSTMAIGRVVGQVSTNVIVRIRSAILAHV